MQEQYVVYLILAGSGLVLAGFFWQVARAFRTGWLWGLASLVPPFQFLFLARHTPKARPPWLCMIFGLLLIVAAYAINLYRDFGERERIVDGQRHLTLTGWKPEAPHPIAAWTGWGRRDYSLLAQKPDAVVVAMANPDVDDAILGYLKGMSHLEELDLNTSAITDDGLAVLAGLPQLRVLKVAGTAITDAGFREHLAGKEGLMELDAEETRLLPRTLREWKTAVKKRKYLLSPPKKPKEIAP